MNKKLCVNCRAELDFDASFCNECGKVQNQMANSQTQTKQCPKCFNTVNANIPFCSKCGNNFSTSSGMPRETKPNPRVESQRMDFNPPSNFPVPYQNQNPPIQYIQQAPMNNYAQNQFSNAFPGNLQVVAIFQLVVGILEVIGSVLGGFYVLIVGIFTFGIGLLLIFIPLIFLIVGIFSIISGMNGINKRTTYGFSMFVAISQMCLLLMCDVLSFVSGLIGVIFLNNSESKNYFRNN